AAQNGRRMGFADALSWQHIDVGEAAQAVGASAPYVFVVCNPPYGTRMGEAERLASLYAALGQTLKTKFEGARCGVLLGDDAPHRDIGLRANRKTAMRNGAIPCHLFEYEIFKRESA
ncbi:MAG: hypothetical protein VX589_01505, partial [Myxococcota bacterium]|nr:hypothetical protein [Myxococcota bacterium]